jgi:hypothetical protein
MSGNQEQNYKLVTYNALAPTEVEQFKLVTYNALTSEQSQQYKQITYNALRSGQVQNYKFVTYLALAPSSLPPGFGPIPIFPTLPEGYPVKISIVMDTTVGTTKSLREMRVAQQTYPVWDIEIPFEELLGQTQNQTPYGPFVGDQEYMELVQTWLMMYGQTNVFGFNCPWDNSRSGQLIGVGDGVTKVFDVYRTWGTGATATIAPVGLINTVTSVTVGIVELPPSDYVVGRDTITFVTAPANGTDIVITFSYYYLCRFVEDEQDFEEFGKNRWTVPSLKFRAVLWV